MRLEWGFAVVALVGCSGVQVLSFEGVDGGGADGSSSVPPPPSSTTPLRDAAGGDDVTLPPAYDAAAAPDAPHDASAAPDSAEAGRADAAPPEALCVASSGIVGLCTAGVQVGCRPDAGALVWWSCALGTENPCPMPSSCCVPDGQGGQDCSGQTSHRCSSAPDCSFGPHTCAPDNSSDAGSYCVPN